jgi:predicted dehydrogenase
MAKVKAGIIGCGFISGIYLKNIPNFEHLELVACADIDTERAKAKAQKYNLPHTYSVEELLSDPQIQIVVKFNNSSSSR